MDSNNAANADGFVKGELSADRRKSAQNLGQHWHQVTLAEEKPKKIVVWEVSGVLISKVKDYVFRMGLICLNLKKSWEG